jgi:indolepyruvate ferredoxin oxidoreductase alpha subunit
MPERILNGDEAMAHGALAAGVSVVTSYPGSPSSGTVEVLAGLAEQHGLYVEWSSNEKVALELGIGASIAGRRALVCTKSVGMNAMLDPLMALNLTPVHGGLVILLGDDPGGYGSQNDQDTRPLAALLELPLLEPAGPAEAYALMRAAFDASERLRMPVIVRETRSFTQQSEPVELADGPFARPGLGPVREPWRFVSVPSNVVAKHRALHERLDEARHWAEGLPFNRTAGDGGDLGVLAAGFAYRKLLDVLGGERRGGLRLLKLAALHPLPEAVVAEFLSGCRRVLVLEENEPFVEDRLKVLAFDRGLRVEVAGKRSGHVVREGELFRWQIVQALSRLLPEFVPAHNYRAEDEARERPPRENHCAGCRFGEVLDALQSAADERGEELVLFGDPGCLARVADRLDAKYALGSAVAVADGLRKAGHPGRPVALFGDSAFFHTALPAVCNAAVNGSDILMVVLDNGATVTSGFQPNPSVGRDARGRPAPALSIERIAGACGVGFVRGVGPDDLGPALRQRCREALAHRGLGLLVVRTPCDRPAES